MDLTQKCFRRWQSIQKHSCKPNYKHEREAYAMGYDIGERILEQIEKKNY